MMAHQLRLPHSTVNCRRSYCRRHLPFIQSIGSRTVSYPLSTTMRASMSVASQGLRPSAASGLASRGTPAVRCCLRPAARMSATRGSTSKIPAYSPGFLGVTRPLIQQQTAAERRPASRGQVQVSAYSYQGRRGGGGSVSITDRVMAALPYLLPLMGALRYGRASTLQLCLSTSAPLASPSPALHCPPTLHACSSHVLSVQRGSAPSRAISSIIADGLNQVSQPCRACPVGVLLLQAGSSSASFRRLAACSLGSSSPSSRSTQAFQWQGTSQAKL